MAPLFEVSRFGVSRLPDPNHILNNLRPFLDANSDAQAQIREDVIVIDRPWNANTLQVTVAGGDGDLVDALNRLYLPSRFSAVWHRNLRALEFIWISTPSNDPRRLRKFVFSFSGHDYECRFDDASPELLRLARSTRPIAAPNETQHRNLPYLLLKPPGAPELVPSSFWIVGIDWEEATILELSHNINFYMTLYDPLSPTIMIHESSTSPLVQPAASLPSVFPEAINGRPVDPYLLLLWESARGKDPFLQFLYLYQVLEYAAFYHLDEATTAKVKQVLSSPGALSATQRTVHQLIDAVADFKVGDEAKIAAIIKMAVLPDAIWPDFQRRIKYFSEPVLFDGGFRLDPLIQENWSLADFSTGGFPKLAGYCTRIRNALVHSREKRMTDVIHPTTANAALLRPWLEPLRTIAGRTMLYESL